MIGFTIYGLGLWVWGSVLFFRVQSLWLRVFGMAESERDERHLPSALGFSSDGHLLAIGFLSGGLMRFMGL